MIDVPKPRALPQQDPRRAGRAAAAAKRREEREAKEVAEKAKRDEAWQTFKGGKASTASSAAAAAAAAGVEEEKEAGQEEDPAAAAEELLLDRSAGEAAEAELTNQPCYWDAPLDYELQVTGRRACAINHRCKRCPPPSFPS